MNDLKLLQQCYMVNTDYRELYPAIECHNDIYYIQYDLCNNHIRFQMTEENVIDKLWIAQIKRKVIEWISEVKEYED